MRYCNIFDECKKYGFPTPEFKVGHKIVTLVIRFKNSIIPHKTGDESVKGVLKDIFEIIKNNPGIQKPAIASHIGKSEATAKRLPVKWMMSPSVDMSRLKGKETR